MLSNNDEGGHPCLVPDLRESAFNFSLLRIMFAKKKKRNNVCFGFVVYDLYYVEIFCLYAHFLESLFVCFS